MAVIFFKEIIRLACCALAPQTNLRLPLYHGLRGRSLSASCEMRSGKALSFSGHACSITFDTAGHWQQAYTKMRCRWCRHRAIFVSTPKSSRILKGSRGKMARLTIPVKDRSSSILPAHLHTASLCGVTAAGLQRIASAQIEVFALCQRDTEIEYRQIGYRCGALGHKGS